ncbi:class I SAM-dependent RNA methyltransferase [Microbacterium sp. P01]|uniref:class I SAM-dependent RNA methyltransferase n=1 Tax=unclassified Microbacterium TaxID=2609290 RepID=UPI00367122C3
MESGELIDLDITAVAHGGVFVGRIDDEDGGRGRVVFVPDTMPGERVRVRLTDVSKPSFWRGEALEVLDASPHRRPHVWRAADIDIAPDRRPGGADFGHIDLAHQRALKHDVLRDALERIGRLQVGSTIQTARETSADDGSAPIENSDGTGWRTRLSLHVDENGAVGPFAARSHRVIPVEDHPLATDAIARAARDLRGDGVGRIDLVQPSDGRVRVIARAEPPRGRARGRRRPAPVEPATAREVVLETVAGRDFRVDAGGFWQVHRLAAYTLSEQVKAGLRALRPTGPAIDPDASHLDLYGGVGLFAAALGDLAGRSARITSVESDERATEHAGENLAEWVGARAETARVDRYLARLRAEASAVERERISRGVTVLDPPRAGAGREVVESLIELAPARVVYVACDPVALARDLATFRAGGYDVAADIAAFDIFPNSHHVEAVAVLTRDGAPD